MMASVQTTGGLERRMEVQVPAERVQQEVDRRLLDVGRKARLDGFRPGKVPATVIRQRFGEQVRREVIDELVRSSFAEAVVEQKLDPAGGPRIEQINTLAGQDLRYAATFEVYPEIELRGLKGLKVERPVTEVTEADVDAMIERLRSQRPNWRSADRVSHKGDRVTVDFEGRVDGKSFEGGTATDFQFVLGAGQMLPDFDKGLDGVTVGTDKTISLRFPDDYQAKALAGKSAEFAVKVKAIEEPELPPIDEEFCKAYGVNEGGIAELRRQIAENMRHQVEETVQTKMRTEVLDQLLAANPLELLPKALVESRISDMQVELARRTGIREVAQLPPREKFLEPARRQVALSLLINEIIKLEKVQPDPEKVQSRLERIVVAAHNAHAHHHADPQEHQRHVQEMMQSYRQDAQAMYQIETLVLEDQVIEGLLARAQVTEQHKSFKELTNFGA